MTFNRAQLPHQIGDEVWFVRAGHNQRYITCPDCCGTMALTVIMGDGTQVSIDCECCREGVYTRGEIKVYDWHCSAACAEVTGIRIGKDTTTYTFTGGPVYIAPERVFATKEEAELEATKVLAEHTQEEHDRINKLKDPKGRMKTWAWNATYHRSCIRRAEQEIAYHQSKLAVAKAKAKTPEAE